MKAKRLKVEGPDENGMLYIYLQPERWAEPKSVQFSIPITKIVTVDYDSDGNVFGIEVQT